jgi:hypothetical protein
MIATFEKEGREGKTIPRGGILGKLIRLRIDSGAPEAIPMLPGGYSNVGVAVLTNLSLANSEHFVFGDVFPMDQVEVSTNFPQAVRRLCVLMGQ